MQAAVRVISKPPLQVSIPALEAGLAAYYILAMSEASSNLSRYDGIRYGRRTQVLPAACLAMCQPCLSQCMAVSVGVVGV